MRAAGQAHQRAGPAAKQTCPSPRAVPRGGNDRAKTGTVTNARAPCLLVLLRPLHLAAAPPLAPLAALLLDGALGRLGQPAPALGPPVLDLLLPGAAALPPLLLDLARQLGVQ